MKSEKKHFSVKSKIVDCIDWELSAEGDAGFFVKAVSFFTDGSPAETKSWGIDFGHVTNAERRYNDRLNLFSSKEEANVAASLMSSGTEDGTECFLVFAVSIVNNDIVALPVGGFWQLGVKL